VSTVSAITEELYSCIPEIVDPDPASPQKKFMICEGCGGTGLILCEGYISSHSYDNIKTNEGTPASRHAEWLALVTGNSNLALPYRCYDCEGVGHHVLR
jgi:hypothetical protein